LLDSCGARSLLPCRGARSPNSGPGSGPEQDSDTGKEKGGADRKSNSGEKKVELVREALGRTEDMQV